MNIEVKQTQKSHLITKASNYEREIEMT